MHGVGVEFRRATECCRVDLSCAAQISSRNLNDQFGQSPKLNGYGRQEYYKMNTLDKPTSNCTQIPPEFDGFDLYAAEGRAMDIVAAARGIDKAELLDDDNHTIFNRVSAEANDLSCAAHSL